MTSLCHSHDINNVVTGGALQNDGMVAVVVRKRQSFTRSHNYHVHHMCLHATMLGCIAHIKLHWFAPVHHGRASRLAWGAWKFGRAIATFKLQCTNIRSTYIWINLIGQNYLGEGKNGEVAPQNTPCNMPVREILRIFLWIWGPKSSNGHAAPS